MVVSHLDKAKKWIESKEKDLARSLIKYKYSKGGQVELDESSLNSTADEVVSEANNILKNRGKKVFYDISTGMETFMKKLKNDE